MCACVFQLPRVARKHRDATSICDSAILVVDNTFAFSDFLKLVRRVGRAPQIGDTITVIIGIRTLYDATK